ncbi:MAG TPA: hypothetical protein VMM92_09870 [Thermoanaerobaculia bacterium]|nr:hypothetical protein [Thermoanaerobaculia bacterium]
MARLTPDHDAWVVRLVYDGPPRSGKTTSLRALAGGMARTVVSPLEVEGRTLYFDWLEYVGGNFEGLPIHCQILSVPGQRNLTRRRQALLADADAIVLVIDSTAEHLPGAQAHLAELREVLASLPAPKPGVVVQANHRDRPEASPLPTLHESLGLEGLAVVESVATANQGIREAFVLAVRLALDRTRELQELGALPASPGPGEDPDALLAWLQSLEAESPLPRPPAPEPPPPAHPGGRQEAGAGDLASPPRLPDSSTPPGQIQPPIEGRMFLHAAGSPAAVPQRAKDGSWRCNTGSWHFHSAPRHEFQELKEGLEELARWAQQHATGRERLSPQRCLALAETGSGTSRLWQVVRSEKSLRQKLKAALQEAQAAGAAPALTAWAALLLAARAAFHQPPALPCRSDLVGERAGRPVPVYVGLLPPAGWKPSEDELALADRTFLRRELQPLLEATAAERRWSTADLLAAVRALPADSASSVALAEALEAIA